MIHTTNTIERLYSTIRQYMRSKTVFTGDHAACKAVYLAINIIESLNQKLGTALKPIFNYLWRQLQNLFKSTYTKNLQTLYGTIKYFPYIGKNYRKGVFIY